MKNKFMYGFISGLVVSLFLTTGCLAFAAYRLQTNSGSKTIPNAVASEKNNTEVTQKDITNKMKRIRATIDKYYLEEIDEVAIANGIYEGMIKSLNDPYAAYYTEEQLKSLLDSNKGTYYGIGVIVSQNPETGFLVVVKPYENGPGYEAGLRPGDIIYKIDGEEVTGKDLSEVVSRVKGEEGTTVKFSIFRGEKNDELEFEIVRREVQVPTISYEMLEDKIGYIEISEFDEITVTQFETALDELESQGQKGLIIDLRNNPGGLLDAVVSMLDRMLPKGLIVYTEDKYGNREEFVSTNKEQFKKPLVILTNEHSASAAELFSGAIQDYGVGTLVGMTTFGKGIAQSVIPLSDNTAVKLTVSKYYTPKGRNIHGVGVKPDIEIDLPADLKTEIEIEKEEDVQLQKGIEVLEEKIAS